MVVTDRSPDAHHACSPRRRGRSEGFGRGDRLRCRRGPAAAPRPAPRARHGRDGGRRASRRRRPGRAGGRRERRPRGRRAACGGDRRGPGPGDLVALAGRGGVRGLRLGPRRAAGRGRPARGLPAHPPLRAVGDRRRRRPGARPGRVGARRVGRRRRAGPRRRRDRPPRAERDGAPRGVPRRTRPWCRAHGGQQLVGSDGVRPRPGGVHRGPRLARAAARRGRGGPAGPARGVRRGPRRDPRAQDPARRGADRGVAAGVPDGARAPRPGAAPGLPSRPDRQDGARRGGVPGAADHAAAPEPGPPHDAPGPAAGPSLRLLSSRAGRPRRCRPSARPRPARPSRRPAR